MAKNTLNLVGCIDLQKHETVEDFETKDEVKIATESALSMDVRVSGLKNTFDQVSQTHGILFQPCETTKRAVK